jgi:hypothetical protein
LPATRDAAIAASWRDLAGRGELHVFVQKYALFAAGRFSLGMRGSTFTFF